MEFNALRTTLIVAGIIFTIIIEIYKNIKYNNVQIDDIVVDAIIDIVLTGISLLVCIATVSSFGGLLGLIAGIGVVLFFTLPIF